MSPNWGSRCLHTDNMVTFPAPLITAAASMWAERHDDKAFPNHCTPYRACRGNRHQETSFCASPAPSLTVFRFKRIKRPSPNKTQKTGYWFPMKSQIVLISIYRWAIACLTHLNRQTFRQSSNWNWFQKQRKMQEELWGTMSLSSFWCKPLHIYHLLLLNFKTIKRKSANPAK